MSDDPLERILHEAFLRSDADGRRFILDASGRSSTVADREFVWVQQLVACIKDLLGDSPDWRSLELFWVRLHGVIVELRSARDDGQQQFVVAQATQTWPAIIHGAQLRSIQAIRTAITQRESDIVAVDYHRQRACHMQQSKFRLQYDAKNQSLRRDTRQNPINGKVYTVEEMDETLAVAFEMDVAISLAPRIQRAVDRLWAGFDVMSSEKNFRAFVAEARKSWPAPP